MPANGIELWLANTADATGSPQKMLPGKGKGGDGLPRRSTHLHSGTDDDDDLDQEPSEPSSSRLTTTWSIRSMRFLLESAGIIRDTSELVDLPADAHNLHSFIDDVSYGGSPYIPEAIQDRMPLSIAKHLHLSNYHLEPEAAIVEFQTLSDILDEARRCDINDVLESHWNSAVNYPLLRLAFRSYPCDANVKVWDIMGATIIEEYVPHNLISNRPTQVDLCLALEPEVAIKKFISNNDDIPVNQTAYGPLYDRLITVAIKTKALAQNATGTPQLLVWTRAWVSRIRHIAPETTIPALPMIRIVRNDWYMSWAWMEGEIMRYSTDIRFGDTRCLRGMYQILAALRHLADWIGNVFKPWAIRLFQ